jgi:hypothetical protein
LDFEGDGVRADVRRKVVDSGGGSIGELRNDVASEAIELHNDWEGDNDSPSHALHKGGDHREGGEKDVRINDENGIARYNIESGAVVGGLPARAGTTRRGGGGLLR